MLLRKMLPWELGVLDEVRFSWIVDDVGVFLSYLGEVYIIHGLRLDLLGRYRLLTHLLLIHVHLIHKYSVLVLVYTMVLVE